MKRILKITSVILIQAFLVMDCAWAGDFSRNAGDAATLAPKVQISAQAVQTIFQTIKPGQEILASTGDELAEKKSPSLSLPRRGNAFRNMVIGGILLVLTASPFLGVSAAAMPPSQAPPAMEMKYAPEVERVLADVVAATKSDYPEIADIIRLMRKSGIVSLNFSDKAVMGGTDMSPELILFREILGGPEIQMNPDDVKRLAKIVVGGLSHERIFQIYQKYYNNPEKGQKVLNALINNVPEDHEVKALTHKLKIAIMTHELGHLIEDQDVLKAKIDGRNRFIQAWIAHKNEYRKVFSNQKTIGAVIEDKPNEMLKAVLDKLKVSAYEKAMLEQHLNNNMTQGFYTQWVIINKLIVIFKSCLAIGIFSFLGYILLLISGKIFSRRQTRGASAYSGRSSRNADRRPILTDYAPKRYKQLNLFQRIVRELKNSNRYRSIILAPLLAGLAQFFSPGTASAATSLVDKMVANAHISIPGLFILIGVGIVILMRDMLDMINRLINNKIVVNAELVDPEKAALVEASLDQDPISGTVGLTDKESLPVVLSPERNLDNDRLLNNRLINSFFRTVKEARPAKEEQTRGWLKSVLTGDSPFIKKIITQENLKSDEVLYAEGLAVLEEFNQLPVNQDAKKVHSWAEFVRQSTLGEYDLTQLLTHTLLVVYSSRSFWGDKSVPVYFMLRLEDCLRKGYRVLRSMEIESRKGPLVQRQGENAGSSKDESLTDIKLDGTSLKVLAGFEKINSDLVAQSI